MEANKTFFEKVDLRDRAKMILFLTTHCRYNTMNSWNRSTSWANNLKVYKVIPVSLQDKVFELMETDEYRYEIHVLIRTYDAERDYSLQAGFNGRSGGYLVMYEGQRIIKTIFAFDNPKKLEEYGGRQYEDGYGWKSKEEAISQGLFCKTTYTVSSWPGRSIDSADPFDYQDMAIEDLREIVKKVQRFDQLCDEIVSTTIDMAENCTVEDEEYTVIKTRKVLV